MVSKIKKKNYGRFRFVREPLDSIANNEETHRADFPLSEEMNKRRYPVRALRYWWLSRVIQEEVASLDAPPIIVDVGCDRGTIKRFTPPIEGSKWIGLDMDIHRPDIELAKYDDRIEADFDVGLPVPDATADIVICSHVLEHLPRPDFTMGEIHRILKPGGLLLVGVPTAPKFIAKLREIQFRRQLASGRRVLGQHIHVFWDKRLRMLAEQTGFEVEYSTGTALIRKKGSKLEDYPAWIRFNQIGASLFPAIGQELCMQLRKLSNDAENA